MPETLHGPSGRQPEPSGRQPGADDVLESGPFVDGFSRRTVLGALFVAVVMMPGAIYLGLVAGQTLGPAAEWVTIILFAELGDDGTAAVRVVPVYLSSAGQPAVATGTDGASVTRLRPLLPP